MVGLFEQLAHAKSSSEAAPLSAAEILRRAADDALLPETLDAPPGARWCYKERAYR